MIKTLKTLAFKVVGFGDTNGMLNIANINEPTDARFMFKEAEEFLMTNDDVAHIEVTLCYSDGTQINETMRKTSQATKKSTLNKIVTTVEDIKKDAPPLEFSLDINDDPFAFSRGL